MIPEQVMQLCEALGSYGRMLPGGITADPTPIRARIKFPGLT